MNNQKTITDFRKQFVFRKANNIDELESLLKLRYDVFRDSRVSMFVPENEYELDLDCWDPYANHFGLFQVDNYQSTPVGYVRVVEDSKTAISSDIYSIAYKYPGMLEKISNQSEFPFPLMKYFPDPDKVQSLYDNIKLRGERLAEAGRISLIRSLRSLRLGRYITECSLSFYFEGSIADHAIWGCPSTHKAFYSRYGLKPVEGTTDFNVPVGIEPISCLVGSCLALPNRIRSKLQRMSEEYKRTGQISYRPLSQVQHNITKSNQPIQARVA